jgi:predicted  nucleic acid-binding Zn-ribbon protein
MFRSLVHWSMLALTSPILMAQTPASDPPATPSVLAEIRQLRSDLQAAAVTIQRAQIVMFRMQVQTGVLDRATQRADQVRTQCDQAQSNQRVFASQLEDSEAAKDSVEDPGMRKNFERNMANLKSAIAALEAEVPRCQAEQAEAESQLRIEQNKMNDLQDQLDKLDKALSAYGAK